MIDFDLYVLAMEITFSWPSMNSKGIDDLFSNEIYEKSCKGRGIGDWD